MNYIDFRGTEFGRFVENFCAQRSHDPKEIGHHYDIPFDSIDRLFALYLLEHKLNLVENTPLTIDFEIKDALDAGIPEEIKDIFEMVTLWAYNNYEREGISPISAYVNLVYKAQKGKEEVLKDSYYNGGWFGAS